MQRDGFHFLKDWFGRFRNIGRLAKLNNLHIGGFRYELHLFYEVTASDKLPGKCEDVATLAQAEVVPELLLHVHTERGCALTAIWRTIPQLVSASSYRLMSQPCEKLCKSYLPHGFNFCPFHTMRQLMMNLIPTPHCV